MLEPGSVFEVPHHLAPPPQRQYQENPPARESRWVLVVSSQQDCDDADCVNVQTVLLSTRVDLGGPFDVVIQPGGGVPVACIAQSDIVITLDKRELTGVMNAARYRGPVHSDTLAQVRALLRARLDLF